MTIFDIKKISCNFSSSIFGHQYPGSGLDPDPYRIPDSLEMLDPDLYPDPDAINPDPQLCLKQTKNRLKITFLLLAALWW
jgi:hypothetical protein